MGSILYRFAFLLWFPVLASAGQEVFVPPSDGPSEAQVQGWVEANYPGLLQSSVLPQGLVLGFVVTPDFKVLRHSATMQRMVPVNRDLERMFPPLSFERPPMAGADCLPAAAGRPGYCVYWVVAPADLQTSGSQ